jgi:hypothetical protein
MSDDAMTVKWEGIFFFRFFYCIAFEVKKKKLDTYIRPLSKVNGMHPSHSSSHTRTPSQKAMGSHHDA